MAAISLTDPVAATTVTAGLHAGNNAALRTAINGGLDNTNVAAAGVANIDVGKLAATAWTAYTPAWTSNGVAPVLNNGTIAGRYQQIAKTVVGRLTLTMGAATTFGTGLYILSLPVAAAASFAVSHPVGTATISDASASALYMHHAILASSTTIILQSTAAPAATAAATVPITFATSDIIMVQFSYEAA